MTTNKMNTLEAWALIEGPVVALLFFLLEPGSVLINPTDISDGELVVRTLASNRVLAHINALMVPLGLALLLYGLTGLTRAMPRDTMSAALSRLGALGMTIGIVGWILSAGLNHVLAQTRIEVEQELERAMSVHLVDSGITLISSIIVSAGFIAFSLGLSSLVPSGFSRIAARVITAVSVIALIAFIIGHTGSNATMITVARVCYFPWVIWSVILGVQSRSGTLFTEPDGR